MHETTIEVVCRPSQWTEILLKLFMPINSFKTIRNMWRIQRCAMNKLASVTILAESIAAKVAAEPCFIIWMVLKKTKYIDDDILNI
jgi:hypothetical protein